MLSIELIRRDPEFVKNALESRGEEDPLSGLLELDAQRRQAVSQGDELRSQRNQVSRQIGQLRSSGEQPAPEVVEEMRQVGERISQLEQQTRELEERIHTILLELPNLPRPGVPPGLTEEGNIVARQVGEPKTFDFTAKPHWDLAEELGIIDFQRGVKLAGSRFYTMSSYGAKLERATAAWMLDLHTREHGYTELMLPLLVKREIMEGSGNLPKFADNLYHDEEDDLWYKLSA